MPTIIELTPNHEHWPTQLHDLGPDEPEALWAIGDTHLLAKSSLAITGARACTGYGAHVTAEIAEQAAAAGITVLAGASYGIDAAAHRAVLTTSQPTIAVLAGGVDRPYPQAHKGLLERIAYYGGLVLSGEVPGTSPTRDRFRKRSTLMAAMSTAFVVTEAGARSGALQAACEAHRLGRPVGAVPGPITSAASTGCHLLIRDHGARLVTSAADVLALVASTSSTEGAAS